MPGVDYVPAISHGHRFSVQIIQRAKQVHHRLSSARGFDMPGRSGFRQTPPSVDTSGSMPYAHANVRVSLSCSSLRFLLGISNSTLSKAC